MMLLPKKLIVIFSILIFISVSVLSQDSVGAVQDWKITSKKIGDNKFELVFQGAVTGNWQIYAPNQTLLEVKTTELKFSDSSIVQEGDFILETAPKEINSASFDNAKVGIYENTLQWKAKIKITGTVPAKLQGTLFYTYGKDNEFYPSTRTPFVIALEGGVESTARIKISSIDINNPKNPCGDDDTAGKSLWAIFGLGLLGGFLALLTPCVFPLIPLTVSFFTKKSIDRKKGIRNAFFYGLFIFLIYVLLSLPFHLFLNKPNPEILNNISTNIWLNIGFFVVFVVFAISFFGYFEITLPGGLANKIDSRSGIGNLGGIFLWRLLWPLYLFPVPDLFWVPCWQVRLPKAPGQ